MSKFIPQSLSRTRLYIVLGAISLLALASVFVVHAAISLSTSTAYTQNFDGMGTSATATLPTDWRVDKPSTVRTVGTFAAATATTNLAGGANLSSTASNGIYNFGAGTTTTGPDRAVGFLSSGTATSSGNLYAQLVNSTGGNLSGVQISYDVEKYRNGINANGFRIQMFYSFDGTTWTSAGSDFLTSFGADANNNGFSPAPGATVSVTNKTLTVFVGSGSNLYLAWNYSVTATSTTTNAQALAIDNVSILGIAGGGSTNPTGTGTASPSSVDQGGTTLLTVAVTPGTNPPSVTHTVSANLSSIGGSSSQAFHDDGLNGDAVAGDNTFSFIATVSNGASPGAKSLPVTITETAPLARTGSTSIAMTVNTPTPPTGVGASNPSTVQAGNNSLLTVSVTPGTHPASTGLAVTANLSSIGGSATQQFFDNGNNGDVTAGDNVFSFNATVSSGTSAGAKNLPAVITDAQSRTGSANIALNVTSPVTSPTGTGAANPSSAQAGNASLLTVTVTPGTNPTSTGLTVTANLSSIGGSGSQAFADDGMNGDATAGDNIFSYNATVSVTTTAGAKSLPFSISDAESRSGSGNISLTVTPQVVSPGTVVISQVYGGGGNSGATYTNDFVELFNRGNITVNLSGWSVQYTSSSGTGSWSRTNLTGTIAPGQYYLVQEGAGTGGTTPLPTPNATGTIAMSATSGHIALVSSTTTLPSGCPTGPQDLIGYGSAACFEGAGPAPGLDNVTADFRSHLGCKDTDSNGGNFFTGPPNPRNTSSPTTVCPTGDFEPEIFATVPEANETHVAVDSNITINFDEPVTVTGNWFQISCTSGMRTATVSGGPTSFTLNPDSDFGFNEPCTVTVFASQVTDQDTNDPPDNMAADYVFSFNSEFQRDPAEHMVMGNPSNATMVTSNSTDFLMMKIQYALSYNDSKGAPNWTSWHLDSSWRGSAPRQDDFRADTTLPPGYHQVQGTDFSGSGFDRGHMCPSADRTSTIADNSATFLMDNMIAQSPDNNQGPWAAYENYLRTFLPGNEIYIISGGTGTGGTGSNGSANTIAGGFVNVPAKTWKVALILPVGDSDVSRVDSNTRTIAVIMPNIQGIRSDQWQKYLATVDQAEALSSYNFYSNVPTSIQDVIEARLDAANDTAPVASDASATTAEENSRTITLSASDFNVNNVLTFIVAGEPAHGSLGAIAPASCSNGNCTTTVTYTPAANYNGPDSFTFTVNDGALDSATPGTVNINVTEVNDNPSAVNDSKQTAEDSSLNFPASDLTANDSAGPNESEQTLTVDAVISTPNTHGNVVLSAGQITYTPDANYNGPASFDYHFCDNGTTNGSPDSKCATGIVDVTVTEVNDDVTANNDSKSTGEDSTLNFPASDLTTNDSAGPANESGQALTVTSVTQTVNTHGSVSLSSGQINYSPDANYNGPASFDYQVCDNGTTNGSLDSKCASATVNLTVTDVNDAPSASTDAKNAVEDTTLNFSAGDLTANDSAGPPDENGQSLTVSSVSQTANTHGSVSLSSGTVTYVPDANYNGPASFEYQVCDNGTTNGAADSKCSTGSVNVTVSEVNDSPSASADAKSTDEDTTLNFPSSDLTANDSTGPANESGQTLTVTAVSPNGNTHGTVSLNAGQISYSPAANYNGPASFDYQVCDNGTTSGAPDSKCANGVVDVTVNSVNDNPVAIDDSANTNEDTSVTIDVVANDTDVDGDTVTLASVSNAVNGSVSISSGQAVFSPTANFHGIGSFDYEASDGHGGTATGHVTVTVNSVNDNPVAVDDSAGTNEDTPVTISVLANDSDVDNDPLAVSAVTQGAYGSVVNNGSSVSYSPAANYNGGDSFTYTASDGHGGTATATVNVTINSVNDNPVAVNDSTSTNEDTSVTIDVVANDTDVDGDSLTLSSVGSAAHGSVSIVSGKAVYSPAANYNGPDSFTYVVSDGHGGQATGNVSVTVNPVNDAPTANSQSVNTNANTPVAITLTGNDIETPSGSLTYTVTSGPSHGILAGTGANQTYTPSTNYSGPDSFKFTVTDTGDGSSPALTSSEATVSITVNDTVGPTINLNGNQISLWPPNHSYHTVNVSDLVASASDNFDPNVNLNSVVIALVTSDEIENGDGDGNTMNDIVIASDCKSVQLRAERESSGDGRVYTITFLVRDAAGNTTTATAKVTVPKNNGGDAVDSGPHYTVNSTCQ